MVGELPKQPIFHAIDKTRREIAPCESHGDHPVLIWVVDDNFRYVSAIPLTSATLPDGTEKWEHWRETWVRLANDGHPSMCDVSGLRQIDRWRLKSKVDRLDEYEVKEVALKLRSWLRFI